MPVSGRFATEIRRQVRRIQQRELSAHDREAIRKNQLMTEQHIVLWK